MKRFSQSRNDETTWFYILCKATRAAGLGHAVWCARNIVANEPVSVLLADDLILENLRKKCEAWRGNMVATMKVDPNRLHHMELLPLEKHLEISLRFMVWLKNLNQKMLHQQ